MKINPNDLAIPVFNELQNRDGASAQLNWRGGLTIRAELASRNLAALLSQAERASTPIEQDINEAVLYTDLLIAKLNEEEANV